MSELEMKIEALRKCVPQEAYEKALAEIMSKSNHGRKADAPEVMDEVYKAMLDLAIPSNLKGYPYIARAVEMVVRDRSMIDNVIGGIYTTIANEFDTTKSRVERAIRHAIEVGWIRADWDIQRKYFGNTVSADKGKPTNSEFIAQVAAAIRRRIKE